MKRVAPIIAGLALAALLALPATPLPTGSDEAAAAACTWQRQTKRIVKHVRRHGKLRKVVRKRHRWICVAQPAAPATAPPAPAPVPTPPAPAPEPEPEANRLSVKAAEYYFNLSRPTVRAGEVTIELNNRGEDPHNLNIQLQDGEETPLEIPETESLQRSVASFDLPAGSYHLWCSLPEHEEKGMHTTLVVE